MSQRLVTGTLETIDGRSAVRIERHLDHPVDRVWRSISEPGELASWFPSPIAWKPTPREAVEIDGESGEIVDLQTPRGLGVAGDPEMRTIASLPSPRPATRYTGELTGSSTGTPDGASRVGRPEGAFSAPGRCGDLTGGRGALTARGPALTSRNSVPVTGP